MKAGKGNVPAAQRWDQGFLTVILDDGREAIPFHREASARKVAAQAALRGFGVDVMKLADGRWVVVRRDDSPRFR